MSLTFETQFENSISLRKCRQEFKGKKKHQTLKSRSRCLVSPVSDFSSKQKSDPFVDQSKFEYGHFCCGCFDVRNLTIIREDCQVNLLNEVKKAPMEIIIQE